MKYIVILCDGMADYAIPELDGKTPMEAADLPNMDALAKKSVVGLVKTVADGLVPGSDVANLSILGYDPAECYTGRSPLEAISMGIDMIMTDISIRCNLVTVSEDNAIYSEKTMIDYCADDISTKEAAVLIEYLHQKLGDNEFKFYSGKSYRHCVIWSSGSTDIGTLAPPHDIMGQCIGGYLPTGKNAEKLTEIMRKSNELLENHPINIQRRKDGKRPANSVWLWGAGYKPQMESFKNRFGVNGSMVSAVDLLKGIGILLGMRSVDVEGATGYIDSDFEGKARAALNELKNGQDFVYIHIEAPDECGHRNEIFKKRDSLSIIDKQILAPVLEELNGTEYRILITADHATPLSLKTHTNDPVPFLIYDSTKNETGKGVAEFNEKTAAGTGLFVEKGLMSMLLRHS